MPTECSAESFDFGTVEGRSVEAAFDAGLVTSDAGALLLGATDRAIRMMVLTCSADDRVGAIMAAMVARRIRHIPVVDEEGRLRGIVSMSDVVKYQLHEIQAEAHAMREYISGR